MTLVLSPALPVRSDSRHVEGMARMPAAEMLLAAVCALVLSVVHALSRVDRTLSRSMPGFARRVCAIVAQLAGREESRPGTAWTITRRGRTSTLLGTPPDTHLASAATATPINRLTPRAESPRGLSWAASDETRDSHQCESARNAGRHPRGRRAR